MMLESNILIQTPTSSYSNFNTLYRGFLFTAPAGVTKITTMSLVVHSLVGASVLSDWTMQVWSINTTTGNPSANIGGTVSATGTLSAGNTITWDFSADTHVLTPGVRYAVILINGSATPTTIYATWRCITFFQGLWQNNTSSTTIIPNAGSMKTSADGATWTYDLVIGQRRYCSRWTFNNGTEWGIGVPTGASFSISLGCNSQGRGASYQDDHIIYYPGGDVVYNVIGAQMYLAARVGGTGMAANIKIDTAFGSKTVVIAPDVSQLNTGLANFIFDNPVKIYGEYPIKISIPDGNSTNFWSIQIYQMDTNLYRLPTSLGKCRASSGGTMYSAATSGFRFILDGEQPFLPAPINRRKLNSVR